MATLVNLPTIQEVILVNLLITQEEILANLHTTQEGVTKTGMIYIQKTTREVILEMTGLTFTQKITIIPVEVAILENLHTTQEAREILGNLIMTIVALEAVKVLEQVKDINSK